MLAAFVSDPAWAPQAFDQARASYATSLAEQQASPTGVLGHAFSGLIHHGDPRWDQPDAAGVATATLSQTKALLAPALASGPIDVTVVGDTTVDARGPRGGRDLRRAAAARCTGFAGRCRPALPRAGTAAGRTDPSGCREPGARHHRLADQRLPVRHEAAAHAARGVGDLLAASARRSAHAREGITYTPGASTVSSIESKTYGYLYALAQIPPDKIATFYASAGAVAADLRDKPVAEDELARARGPRIEDIQRQQQTNEVLAVASCRVPGEPRACSTSSAPRSRTFRA